MRKVPTLIPPDIESPERLRAYLDDLERRRLDFPTFTISDGLYTKNVYDDLQIEGVGMAPMGTGQRGMYLTLGKNRLIGGDFTVNPWQRGTSFATAADRQISADRWIYVKVGAGVVTLQKTADAPTAVQTNGYFTQHCLDVDVTTADTSIASTDLQMIGQKIEGYNISHAGFGQAGTRYVTLSFWVKTTVTGIYCISLSNGANNRSIVKEYTVSASDTWEKKVLTFPTDTSGTWLYDSGIGLQVYWTIMAGSAFQIAADAWANAGAYATANQVNGFSSTSNNFKIALCQLEYGQAASAFEWQDREAVLAQCQRYLPAWNVPNAAGIAVGQAISTTQSVYYMPHRVSTRAAPTGAAVSAAGHFVMTAAGFGAIAVTALVFLDGTTECATVTAQCAGGLVAGDATFLYAANAAASIQFTGIEI